tara:strand:+ start:2474 stop:2599 length:126 start_codon:yes stop_codon:yes gene_type:complete
VNIGPGEEQLIKLIITSGERSLQQTVTNSKIKKIKQHDEDD